MHFEVDNLRLLGPHSWRDVVHRISGSVPIVVLDTRLASPAVVEETERMIQEPFRDKTLFVVADDGSAPSITATGHQISLNELRTARLRDVVGMLRNMGLSKTTSPDDNPLLAQASFARNSKRMERGMEAVARVSKPFAATLEIAERVRGLTPFVMVPLYWLLFREAADRAPGRIIAFLLLAALWVEGHGMHLSAPKSTSLGIASRDCGFC